MNVNDQTDEKIKNILVVDDDKSIIKLYTSLLADMNIEVDVAYNGAEVIEKIKENTYDLVFLDLKLPDTDGKDLLKSIEKFSGVNLKKTKSRKRNIVEARQLFCKLMRDYGYTYEAIGDSIGVGHPTVLYHCRNYEYIRKASPELKDLEKNVLNDLNEDDQEIIKSKINFFKGEIKKLEEILSHSTKNV